MVFILIMLLFCFILNYKISKNDVMAPVPILILSLILGACFTIPGLKLWNDKICFNTVLVYFIGLICITCANLFSFKVRLNSMRHDYNYQVKDKLIIIATIVSTFCVVLYAYNAYKVGVMNGGTGLSAFAYMKNAYLADDNSEKMNVVIRQFFKVVMAIGYVNGYIYISSIVNKSKLKINKYCLLSIINACVITICSGSRTEIFKIVSALIISASVLMRERSGWGSRENKAAQKVMIKKIIPIALVLFLLLFLTRNIVKTGDVETSKMTSIINYIIYYFGSPLEILNTKISRAYGGGGLWLNNSLAESIAGSHEYLGMLNYGGNVATMFQSVLYNGLLFMGLRLFVYIFIITSLYRSFIYNTVSGYKRDRNVIIFSAFYYVFTIGFYANCFTMATNLSSIIMYILIIIYFKLLKGKKDENNSILFTSIS